MCISVCASVFVCSRVWASLQLRGEAIAIPTDLKTSLPATSKYRGMGKKRENVSEHQWSENTHLEIVASGRVEKIWKRKKNTQVQWGDYRRNGTRRPLCTAGSNEKNEKTKKKTERENGDWQKTMEGNVHEASAHTQQDGKQVWDSLFKCWQGLCMGVWMCGSMSLFFAFVTPKVSRGQERIPFLSRALFSYTYPPPPQSTLFFFSFLYTHSSSPPSLLAQRWMALSFWWVTDEWSSSLKSRVTARPVKREEMPDKRWQRARGEREGREEKRGRGGGKGTCGGGTVNIIKSVRDGGSMCVAERARSAFLHECLGLFALWCSKGQHHANGK